MGFIAEFIFLELLLFHLHDSLNHFLRRHLGIVLLMSWRLNPESCAASPTESIP